MVGLKFFLPKQSKLSQHFETISPIKNGNLSLTVCLAAMMHQSNNKKQLSLQFVMSQLL